MKSFFSTLAAILIAVVIIALAKSYMDDSDRLAALKAHNATLKSEFEHEQKLRELEHFTESTEGLSESEKDQKLRNLVQSIESR